MSRLADGRVAMWTTSTGLSLSLVKIIRSPRPLRTYPVLVRDERLLVDLEPEGGA
jgi:3-phenylpropionate/trans-cinnamate dioxygenase ferredoxin subunit